MKECTAPATAPVGRKLAAARARLMLERPFIGALVMHLPLVATERVRTIGTDARRLYFNPRFIAALTLSETQFVLAHQALHCALGHGYRGRHRVRARWDRACDYCVNQLLVDDGMSPPAGALVSAAYRGLAAEEIYALLNDRDESRPLDEHLVGAMTGADGEATLQGELVRGSSGDTKPRAHTDEQLAGIWQDRLAAAASEAGRGGRLGRTFRDVADRLLQPRLPWRALLARFLMATARDDYSFQRPGRRTGTAMLPGLKSTAIDLIVALDTSGSVAPADADTFLAEIDALKGDIRARITLLACDARLAPGGPWHFEAWEPVRLPPGLPGGGGTRFTPVFEWVEQQGPRPDALLYCTDAQGEFPACAPGYPVLWLVKGSAPVPWGERVPLN